MLQLNILIPEDLLKKLKIHAVNENKSLKTLCNEILYKAISQKENLNPELYKNLSR